MALLTKEQIDDIRSQHGDRLMRITNPTEMIFKAPPRPEWADFQDSVAKDKGTREGAYRRLCLACLCHPSMDDGGAIFDKYPALPTKVGDALAGLVGLGEDFDIKKI